MLKYWGTNSGSNESETVTVMALQREREVSQLGGGSRIQLPQQDCNFQLRNDRHVIGDNKERFLRNKLRSVCLTNANRTVNTADRYKKTVAQMT